MKECKICHSTEKIIFHHLSYEPEIGIDVCRACHFGLHQICIEALEKIIKLKKEYGHLWINGREQYSKTERQKEIIKEYHKTQKYKDAREKYYKKYKENRKEIRKRYKEKHPEKIKEWNKKYQHKRYEKKKLERVAL